MSTDCSLSGWSPLSVRSRGSPNPVARTLQSFRACSEGDDPSLDRRRPLSRGVNLLQVGRTGCRPIALVNSFLSLRRRPEALEPLGAQSFVFIRSDVLPDLSHVVLVRSVDIQKVPKRVARVQILHAQLNVDRLTLVFDMSVPIFHLLSLLSLLQKPSHHSLCSAPSFALTSELDRLTSSNSVLSIPFPLNSFPDIRLISLPQPSLARN